jgi:hypothetical protein
LLLYPGLIAEFHVRQFFGISRLIRAHDAALRRPRQALDAILEGRAQQRLGIEFRILAWQAIEREGLFDQQRVRDAPDLVSVKKKQKTSFREKLE